MLLPQPTIIVLNFTKIVIKKILKKKSKFNFFSFKCQFSFWFRVALMNKVKKFSEVLSFLELFSLQFQRNIFYCDIFSKNLTFNWKTHEQTKDEKLEKFYQNAGIIIKYFDKIKMLNGILNFKKLIGLYKIKRWIFCLYLKKSFIKLIVSFKLRNLLKNEIGKKEDLLNFSQNLN